MLLHHTLTKMEHLDVNATVYGVSSPIEAWTNRYESSITLVDSPVVNWEIRNLSSEKITHRDGICGSWSSSQNLSVLS